MSAIEQQVVSLLAQLNRNALLRIMENIVSRLRQEDEELHGLSQSQWQRMEANIKSYEDGGLSVISREELEKRVKEGRK